MRLEESTRDRADDRRALRRLRYQTEIIMAEMLDLKRLEEQLATKLRHAQIQERQLQELLGCG